LAEVAVPSDSIVTAVIRHDAAIVPSGNTRIQPDDVLLNTAQRDRAAHERHAAWARGERQES
jgi:Trk K+ transport system NAD-binding subunit